MNLLSLIQSLLLITACSRDHTFRDQMTNLHTGIEKTRSGKVGQEESPGRLTKDRKYG
jgi:hypothetical protein